jgi:hypothetical protein
VGRRQLDDSCATSSQAPCRLLLVAISKCRFKTSVYLDVRWHKHFCKPQRPRARHAPFTHRREELRVAKGMNSRQTLILWQELQPKFRGIQIRRNMGQEPETGAKS